MDRRRIQRGNTIPLSTARRIPAGATASTDERQWGVPLNPTHLAGLMLYRTPSALTSRAERETRVIHRIQVLQDELSVPRWNWHSERLLEGAKGLRRVTALEKLRAGHSAEGVVGSSGAGGSLLGYAVDELSRSSFATGEAVGAGLLLAGSLGWGLRTFQLRQAMKAVSLDDLKTVYAAQVTALGLTHGEAGGLRDQPTLVALMASAADSFARYEPSQDSVTHLLKTATGKPLTPITRSSAREQLELPASATVRTAIPRVAGKLRIIQGQTAEQIWHANLLMQRWDMARDQLPQH